MEKKELDKAIEQAAVDLEECRKEIGKRIVGQSYMIDGIFMALLAGGHVLIEGVPGLAKTLAINTLAEIAQLGFKRIQFTPDLLPADLVGTMIYRQDSGQFMPRKGPVFTNIVLADEINRSPAKVQSALLEAMAEQQVTLGETTYTLPKPFFVLATQNPIEHEGTYPLPEAQLDRFLLKLKIPYPENHEELEILRRMGTEKNIQVKKVLSPEKIVELRRTCAAIRVDPRIEEYIVSLVTATRSEDRSKYPFVRFIEYGASPRATIYLFRCAKIFAAFNGRSYVVPDDVKAVAYDVLRHRLVLSYEAESEELKSEQVIEQILNIIPVP